MGWFLTTPSNFGQHLIFRIKTMGCKHITTRQMTFRMHAHGCSLVFIDTSFVCVQKKETHTIELFYSTVVTQLNDCKKGAKLNVALCVSHILINIIKHTTHPQCIINNNVLLFYSALTEESATRHGIDLIVRTKKPAEATSHMNAVTKFREAANIYWGPNTVRCTVVG